MGFAVSAGRFLFRWRAVVGFGAFVLAYLAGAPTTFSCLTALPILLFGLGLRLWAMGYLGCAARSDRIGGGSIVTSGPYRLFPHPIYAGNLFLVLGMLRCLALRWWWSLGLMVGFLVEYGLIAYAETRFLRTAGLQRERVRFDWRRGLCERHTWLVTGIAYFLCLARAVWF